MDITYTSESDNVKDYLLDLNDLGKPKVIDMTIIENGVLNPAILNYARLIVMRKGTDPDRPNMGIDIVARYRFADIDEIYTLQSEIEQQGQLYLPEFIPVTVNCQAVTESNQDRAIVKVAISITIQGTMYQVMYNVENSKLEILQN